MTLTNTIVSIFIGVISGLLISELFEKQKPLWLKISLGFCSGLVKGIFDLLIRKAIMYGILILLALIVEFLYERL